MYAHMYAYLLITVAVKFQRPAYRAIEGQGSLLVTLVTGHHKPAPMDIEIQVYDTSE